MQGVRIPPTLCGLLALIFWSLTAIVTVELYEIPTFQILFFNFLAGFIISCVWTTGMKQWKNIAAIPGTVWVVGILGLFCNLSAYTTAFKMAPAAQVDLIYYLWPLFTICLTSVFSGQKFSPKYMIGAVLGFMGVFFLIFGEHNTIGLPRENIMGYGYAIFAALSWTGYIIFSSRHPDVPPYTIGLCCGIAALMSLLSHRIFESHVSMTPNHWGLLLFLGSCITGTSFALWDYGVKKGNVRLLSVLSYFTPLWSIFFLVMKNRAQASIYLLISTLLVVAGSAFTLMHEYKTFGARAKEQI